MQLQRFGRNITVKQIQLISITFSNSENYFYENIFKVLHLNVRPTGGCRVSGRSGAAVVVIVTRVSVASAVSPCPLLRPATRQLRSDPSHHPPPPRLHHVFLYSYPNIRLCPHTR